MIAHQLRISGSESQSDQRSARLLLQLLHVIADSAYECEDCSRRIWIAPAKDLFTRMLEQKNQHRSELYRYYQERFSQAVKNLPDVPSKSMWIHSLWLQLRVELSEFELYILLKDVLDSEKYVLHVYDNVLDEPLERPLVQLIEPQRDQLVENVYRLERQCGQHAPGNS